MEESGRETWGGRDKRAREKGGGANAARRSAGLAVNQAALWPADASSRDVVE